jgi:hypothetical protein
VIVDAQTLEILSRLGLGWVWNRQRNCLSVRGRQFLESVTIGDFWINEVEEPLEDENDGYGVFAYEFRNDSGSGEEFLDFPCNPHSPATVVAAREQAERVVAAFELLFQWNHDEAQVRWYNTHSSGPQGTISDPMSLLPLADYFEERGLDTAAGFLRHIYQRWA